MIKALYYFGLALIAIWLFILHSTFVFAIMPLFQANEFFADLFVTWNGYDLKIYFPYVFGAVFAIIIAITMRLLKRSDKYYRHFAFSIALLELIGFTILNMPDHEHLWLVFSAIYYGIYTFIIIVFYYYLDIDKPEHAKKIALLKPSKFAEDEYERKQKEYQKTFTVTKTGNAKSEIDLQIMQMLQNGITPKEICERLKVKPYKVTRVKQKYGMS